jgi:hypothetical protein
MNNENNEDKMEIINNNEDKMEIINNEKEEKKKEDLMEIINNEEEKKEEKKKEKIEEKDMEIYFLSSIDFIFSKWDSILFSIKDETAGEGTEEFIDDLKVKLVDWILNYDVYVNDIEEYLEDVTKGVLIKKINK